MSLPEPAHAGGPAAVMASPSCSFTAPDAGGQATRPASPYRPGHRTRHGVGVARPAAVEHARNPRVIDGEVTGSWFVRPMLPMLAGSGALFALSVAALVQEALR